MHCAGADPGGGHRDVPPLSALAKALAHLAPCLEISAPACPDASLADPEHLECFSPITLFAAVEFYHDMMPNLKRDVSSFGGRGCLLVCCSKAVYARHEIGIVHPLLQVVADVLQRYGDQKAALEHLLMLSACVEEAARGDGDEVPDQAAWDSASSTTSCDEALMPDTDSRAHGNAADDLTRQEKLAYLMDRFKGLSTDEVGNILAACANQLPAATEMCSFAQNGSGQEAEQERVPLSHSTAAAAEAVEAVAAVQADEAGGLVQQLAHQFPSVPHDSLRWVLQFTHNSLAAARHVLLEQGYTAVDSPVEQQHSPEEAEATQPQSSSMLPAEVEPSNLPLSHITHHKNQSIFVVRLGALHGFYFVVALVHTSCIDGG